MHLSDEELSVYLKDKSSSNEHLEQCEICQKRLNNRSEFRQRLAQTFEPSQFELNWDSLEVEYNKSFNHRQHQQLESKIKKLQLGIVSLAACLCLIVLVPLFSPAKLSQSMDTKLALVINENHQLQRNLELSTPYGAIQTVAIQSLRIKLQQIDKEIQLSYLESLSKAEKLKLWQARKELLINSIEKLDSKLSENTKSI